MAEMALTLRQPHSDWLARIRSIALGLDGRGVLGAPGGVPGQEPYCPDWYPVLRAARWMHVAPWKTLEPDEAARVPRRLWRIWASIAEAAELEARETRQS